MLRAPTVSAAPVEVELSGPEPSRKSPALHEQLPARHFDHGYNRQNTAGVKFNAVCTWKKIKKFTINLMVLLEGVLFIFKT